MISESLRECLVLDVRERERAECREEEFMKGGDRDPQSTGFLLDPDIDTAIDKTLLRNHQL